MSAILSGLSLVVTPMGLVAILGFLGWGLLF